MKEAMKNNGHLLFSPLLTCIIIVALPLKLIDALVNTRTFDDYKLEEHLADEQLLLHQKNTPNKRQTSEDQENSVVEVTTEDPVAEVNNKTYLLSF